MWLMPAWRRYMVVSSVSVSAVQAPAKALWLHFSQLVLHFHCHYRLCGFSRGSDAHASGVRRLGGYSGNHTNIRHIRVLTWRVGVVGCVIRSHTTAV
jgi:hypothetical protein